MTVARLNNFIAADPDVKALGLFNEGVNKQGGYELPKEKTNAENNLHISQKGAYLLDFFYKKSKDGKGYPFNPDKLTDPNIHFCQIGKKSVKRFVKSGLMGKVKEVEEVIEVIGGDKGNSGHLAIGTGIGKTTKLINCLVKGCAYHGGAKGEVEMAYCLRGKPTERATEEEIKEGKHDPEMKSLYKSHGGYPVAKNDLAYWYNSNTGQKEGLEENKKDLKQKVKAKQIPKEDTIVVFDEAHFNDAGYQALQFEMIRAGYNCLRMSATFAGAEFSTTSSFPMKRVFSGKLDPNMPVSLEERIQTGTTWIFGKNLELNDEQIRALGSNVSYMVYTPEFDENCEDISHGRPKGSADNVDGSKEMGYTPGIDTVICLGATETTNLGKYFTESEPTLGFTQISSLVQQMGRVSRIKYGLAITLTKECGEIDLLDNVSAAMVKSTFDGNIKQINDKEYKQIYDVDILRGALAYPDPKTFGKAPEEILMGLKITKDQQSKKEKLAKLV
ncbi:4581_t:CDS:2 [Entrophospora sp. SA101]|nr:10400_t:CDS:2 [Entrophospora sp. SA101]CAJ0747168.1 4581_t:CDS:2 [Entrophospora sp. SA101]